MSELLCTTLPLRVAIVGSGPSGFFAAAALYKAKIPVVVDMFERLATPFGLVRGGVAPDHPGIKKVTTAYEKLVESQDTFSFWGNVKIGHDLTVDDLRRCYDAIVFCHGAESDRRMNIEGEDLRGSHTATAFVAWYNGHPDYRDFEIDLSHEVAVVVGQGNVAMDVSRILAKTPDELKDSDIAAHALEQLAQSKVKQIHLLGRRGPVQAKFTPPELREIGELADCDPILAANDLALSDADEEELNHIDSVHRRKNFDIMKDFAERVPSDEKSRRYQFWFRHSPVELQGKNRVERVVLERNVLRGEAFHQWSEGTGEKSTIDCGLVLRSVGYRGLALDGLPFSEKTGTVPNEKGRVLENDDVSPGLYVAGWIKRGPSGVIGTNKPDAQETVATLLEDRSAMVPAPHRDSQTLIAKLDAAGIRRVSFADWRTIDAAEIENGQKVGKPREKFTRLDEMLALLN